MQGAKAGMFGEEEMIKFADVTLQVWFCYFGCVPLQKERPSY